ncbi:TSUP family transporter [Helicobacter mastomyrinus]|uniref:Probable membrane transporter protein n=1 Tax=Helicobacter mastomyrinus TaxID=287948 RepID=A0ABZ3F6H3_9HELI|nr:TSUP family transporter [uncultured Helicobacter sp.]
MPDIITSFYDTIAIHWYIILFLASIIGGLVGSISGGAGMITMPLLLLSGLNPLVALAVNKIQACVGSFTSAVHYYHQGLVDISQSRILMGIAMIFAALGAISVQYIELNLLSKILPFAMIIIGGYFLLSKHISDEDRTQKPHKLLVYASTIGAGFYGGLLGVGIGSFVLAILVSIAGYGLSKAVAHSRWIVFSINIASTLIFIIGGNVLWLLSMVMCIGQIIGASLGAKIVIKHGAKIIRPLVICTSFLLSLQLLIKEFF